LVEFAFSFRRRKAEEKEAEEAFRSAAAAPPPAGARAERETDTFNDKQSQIAERKTGDGRGPGDHSREAVHCVDPLRSAGEQPSTVLTLYNMYRQARTTKIGDKKEDQPDLAKLMGVVSARPGPAPCRDGTWRDAGPVRSRR
jgi:hypothetical protein